MRSFQFVLPVLCVALLQLSLNFNVNAAPAPDQLDKKVSPFALELQPPLLDDPATIDSYGNPIDTLKPISTPDGRKVVSAQGLQFEIPNYASGITEIRQPANDLLPPHIDAIAVAVPNDGPPEDNETSTAPSFAPQPPQQATTSLTSPTKIHSTSSTTSTSTGVEVEQAKLIPLQQHQEESVQAPLLATATLPDYILELQDPDIAGPVPWTPAPNGAPLSVIAWDLLPPHKDAETTNEQQQTQRPGANGADVHIPAGSENAPKTNGQESNATDERDGPDAHGTNAHVGSTTPRNGRFPVRHRGTAHYSTTTTTTPRPSTTTTPKTTTTPRTTTTRATTTTSTTRRTTTTTAAPRSTTPLDPSTFYKLENEEEYAYTLPPWLQEVTDPDLDVAVTFIVPTDNEHYNHSLSEDLEPPLEPFVDLHNIPLKAPSDAGSATSTTTTTTTTTTERPTSTVRSTSPTVPSTTTTKSTRRPSNWVRVDSTTTALPLINTANNAPHTNTNTHTNQIGSTSSQKQEPLNEQFATTNTNSKTTHTDPLEGAPRPAKPFELQIPSTTSRPTSTTTQAPFEYNPFNSATIPPWLLDFDYPDVGPGVPYNPDNFKETESNDNQNNFKGGSKPNDFQPQGFRTTSTASTGASTTSTTTASITTSNSLSNSPTISSTGPTAFSSAFPSKVTLPLPSINSDEQLNTVEPPLVLVPPADRVNDADESPNNVNNKHNDIAAPTTSAQFPSSISSTTSVTHFTAPLDAQSAPTPPPLPVNEERFPPLTPDAAGNAKVEYTKSDEGKVITTPVSSTQGFGQRKDTQGNGLISGTSSFGQASTPASAPASTGSSNTGKYTGGFGGPPGLLRPQTTATGNTDIYVAGPDHKFTANKQTSPSANNGGRYSGGFNAPSGVLSPQGSPNVPRPFQTAAVAAASAASAASFASASSPSATRGSGSSFHQTRFGGPPGVLVPFDNVQRPAQG